MHARRTLVRAVSSRIPKRHYVAPALSSTSNLGPGFEVTDGAQHAGPSNYLDGSRPSTPRLAELSDLDSHHMARLSEMIRRSREDKRDSRASDVYDHDQVWSTFKSLTKETRNQLSVPMLKRILRFVVPPASVVRQALVAKRNATHSTEAEISSVTEYPWEPRLQLVASIMRFVEERDRKSTGNVLLPEERAMEVEDYHFVLRQFSLTGHLSGSERVFKEMKDAGIPVPIQVYDTRLMVLTKWLTIRKSIYQRFIASKAREEDSHTYGVGQPELARSTPFFPPDAVALFKEILISMQDDQVVYRKLTYDILLRIAKDTKNDSAADRILKLAYNVDLAYPDTGIDALRLRMREEMGEDPTGGSWELLNADVGGDDVGAPIAEQNASAETFPAEESLGGSGKVKWNTHALNTVVYRFAERGDLKGMLQAFEVFGNAPAEADRVIPNDVQPEVPLPEVEEDAPEKTNGVDVEDEPVTLSEALAREEASGQRLDFFGRATRSRDPAVGGGVNKAPKFTVRSAWQFLPSLPFPLEIESRTKLALESEGVTAADLKHKNIEQLSNNSTYRILIKACAVQASLAKSVEERDLAMTLGVHFLRGAVREMIVRHNRFMQVWVRINEVTADLKLPSPPKEEPTEEMRALIKEARLARRRAEMDGQLEEPPQSPVRPVVDPNPVRTTLRQRLHTVNLDFDPEFVLPLYKVLRSQRSARGVPSQKRWLSKYFKQIHGLAELARRYGREEWKVMTGSDWVQWESRKTSKREPGPQGTIAGLIHSLKQEAQRAKEESVVEAADRSVTNTTSIPPILRSGSTLSPAFFTSDLASELHLPWTSTTSPFSVEDPNAHSPPLRRTIVRFDVKKHLGILRTHGREVDVILQDQEASWEEYKRKTGITRSTKKPAQATSESA